MNKYIKKTYFIIFAFIVQILLVSCIFTAAASENYECSIKSVKINKDGDRVTLSFAASEQFVSAHEGETVYFFRLAPDNNTGALSNYTPIAERTLSAEISVSDKFTRQHVYSSYLAAIKNNNGTYAPISEKSYIGNPEILAENTESYKTQPTKKGLVSQISSDALSLGAAHTTIDVEIEDYISPKKSDNTLTHTFFGQTFYINKDKLSSLDHKIKVYSDAGITVYLNIILGAPTNDELDFLYLKNNSASHFFALDTTNTASARHFAAFCEFIAERYSKDGEYGSVPAYVFGYEVNAVSKWGYSNEIDIESYVKYYESAYRILYNAVRSNYSEGKVFVPVSNLFNASEGEGDFGAREFIDAFADECKKHGDIEWALAISPYPSDASLTEFWNDEKATQSTDTEYVTMKNLDVLTDYMSIASLLYNNRVRDIIINSFGINTNADDTDNSERGAAAYALAYVIAECNPHIDAFIYYRHVDHNAESMKFGLWSSSSDTGAIPDAKKTIYGIFKDADTQNAARGLEMAKSYVTAELCNKYLKDYSPSRTRVTAEAIPILKSEIPSKYSESTLFDLTSGSLCDFYPSENAAYVELRPIDASVGETALYSVLKPVSNQTYMGISRKFASDEVLSCDYLTVNFKPVTPSVQTLTVLLRLDAEVDGTKHVYEGISQLSSNETVSLTFKIRDFLKLTDGKINSLRLWYKPSNTELVSGEYGLWLDSITTHEATGIASFISVVLIILPIAFCLALICAVVYIYKNKRILNKIKAFVGKTKSKFLNFLRSKKIISAKYKKPKRQSASKKSTQTKKSVSAPPRKSGPVIINGRVVPMPQRHSPQNERSIHNNLQNNKSGKNREQTGENSDNSD